MALSNVGASRDEAEVSIGSDLISRFQYYRIVRNWVVHVSELDVSRPEDKFKEIEPYSDVHAQTFDSVKGPNRPTELCFDDFILFSRLTKLIAEKLSRLAEPKPDHWIHCFPLAEFRHLENNPKRLRNAVVGRLRTDYGMDFLTARWVADELLGKSKRLPKWRTLTLQSLPREAGTSSARMSEARLGHFNYSPGYVLSCNSSCH